MNLDRKIALRILIPLIALIIIVSGIFYFLKPEGSHAYELTVFFCSIYLSWLVLVGLSIFRIALFDDNIIKNKYDDTYNQ